MPSIVGNIKIVSVSSSSVVILGDCLIINPISTSKSYAGSGSFNTGDLPNTNNLISSTNTNDPDQIDSAAKGENEA
ncbi:spore germination protein [Paenibacillus cymbidii]|uniref:spore germination protein n=1 Tax=Paenibacillus cymbidii TaxID=1639034 RepID=UPI00107FF866|nr:spore germination protein [Paenibacillus cymbidii]